MTKHALNLSEIAWSRQHGDISIIGCWFGDELRPCLVLVPSYRKRSGFRPAVVLIDDAWRWSPDLGTPGYVMDQAPKIVANLGFDVTPQQCARVANLLADHIGDLLTIPPKPAAHEIVADAFMTDEDGKQRHFEIADHA